MIVDYALGAYSFKPFIFLFDGFINPGMKHIMGILDSNLPIELPQFVIIASALVTKVIDADSLQE